MFNVLFDFSIFSSIRYNFAELAKKIGHMVVVEQKKIAAAMIIIYLTFNCGSPDCLRKVI